MSCYQNFFLFVYRLSYVSYDGLGMADIPKMTFSFL